jgi:hypothetical protein
MEKKDLIQTAKVTITDKGLRSNKGSVISTMVIEFETGYRFEWDWAYEKDCTPERIAYHIENGAINAFQELHKNCSESPCKACMQKVCNAINSTNFKYARFTPSELGNYYNIYHNDNTSPTGVSLVSGCSEKIWEQVSKETRNSHNYLSPTENKMSARQ